MCEGPALSLLGGKLGPRCTGHNLGLLSGARAGVVIAAPPHAEQKQGEDGLRHADAVAHLPLGLPRVLGVCAVFSEMRAEGRGRLLPGSPTQG